LEQRPFEFVQTLFDDLFCTESSIQAKEHCDPSND
jgi:hypothetical protein